MADPVLLTCHVIGLSQACVCVCVSVACTLSLSGGHEKGHPSTVTAAVEQQLVSP